MSRVLDVHSRTFLADPAAVGQQLETLASANDDFWVTDLVPPMVLDRGLAVGSSGGHGAVKYSVAKYEPGSLIEFRFDPKIGLDGVHRFEIEGDGEHVTVSHTLEAETSGIMRFMWRPLVLPIHSGVIEDIFDHLERAATGRAHRARPTGSLLRWVSRGIAALESRG
ncbi:SRPBCC family protein [Leucobacter viscericola]|uniref:SRPBCC family protein n=1 Tax=Leucobacter viscericola TaxID=2714935 RepID=A0A6G7XBQ8_9MICO|nr:SRPBCC family protein [Leucobacter viscericola]QIK61811.1 SRPBCC family protein [Leucobacter viscericola]